MVHGIAHDVHQRVGELFHHRLVQLGVRAGDQQLDVLVQLLADIAHHPREALEHFTDGHHAQRQRGITDMFNQRSHGLIGFGHGGRAALAQRQAGGGTGNHQLADQVDQLIQLADLDLDKHLLVHALVIGLFLLAQCGRHQGWRHQLFFHQQGAQRRCWLRRGGLQGQHPLQFVGRQSAALEQNFAEFARRLGQADDQVEVGFDLAVRRQDQQLAVLADKFEGIFDVLLAGL